MFTDCPITNILLALCNVISPFIVDSACANRKKSRAFTTPMTQGLRRCVSMGHKYVQFQSLNSRPSFPLTGACIPSRKAKIVCLGCYISFLYTGFVMANWDMRAPQVSSSSGVHGHGREATLRKCTSPLMPSGITNTFVRLLFITEELTSFWSRVVSLYPYKPCICGFPYVNPPFVVMYLNQHFVCG